LSNIEPTTNQHEDIETKEAGIIACLNREYWDGKLLQGELTSIRAGSWAKGTRVRPSSDLDMLFFLPCAMYHRYEARAGNKQSGILQEIKQVLLRSYPTTCIRSDGPTVIMDFSTYKVEIAPVFLAASSPKEASDPALTVLLCDTNNGGCYKPSAPVAERDRILTHNVTWKGDLIALIRMAKTWKRNCSAPIKSFYLEQMAIEFLAQWKHAADGLFWYDWMMRDFFKYMLSRQNGFTALPVTNEQIFYGDEWVSRAESALARASRACECEERNLNADAGEEWQKVFGYNIPKEA
jgi:hypothetical protein